MNYFAVFSLALLAIACSREEPPATTERPGDTPPPPAEATATLGCAELAALPLTDLEFGEPIAELRATQVAATDDAPGYCHVEGIIWPATEFHIKLPVEWNGRFVMTGNGGPGGPIDPAALDPLVAQGYAAAGDSAGHLGDLPLWSYTYNPPDNSNPHAEQKLKDHGYRSIHETTALAQDLMPRFYGRAPSYSYYMGGSTGGRQGLMNAQRYPDDFDGWAISRPVLDVSHTAMQNVWNSRAVMNGPGTIRHAKLPSLAAAVLEQCDGADGLPDGLISDPAHCAFDPLTDLERCPADTDSDTCFTEAQAQGIAEVYDGPRTSDGTPMFVSTAVSSEQFAPSRLAGGRMASIWVGELLPRDESDISTSISLAYGASFLKYAVYQSESWDWRTANLDDYERADERVSAITDATDPDLRDVMAAGKKILSHHGWSDGLVTPKQTIRYYESVRATLGDEETASFFKLYLIPGMGHISSIGPNQVDWLGTLRRWVEDGVEPDVLVAARPANDALGIAAMTRPLCPYPEIARYSGSGDTSVASNFSCSAP